MCEFCIVEYVLFQLVVSQDYEIRTIIINPCPTSSMKRFPEHNPPPHIKYEIFLFQSIFPITIFKSIYFLQILNDIFEMTHCSTFENNHFEFQFSRFPE